MSLWWSCGCSLIVIGLGCAPRATSTEPQTGDDLEDSAFIADFSAQDAADAAGRLMARGLPSGPVIFAATRALLAEGDADCPGSETELVHDSDGCTASTGYSYTGTLEIDVVTEEHDGGSRVSFSAARALYTIGRPDGTLMQAAGIFNGSRSVSPEGSVELRSGAIGTWVDPASENDWMAVGSSASLTLFATTASEGTTLALSGSWSALGDAIIIDEELAVSSARCPDAPYKGALAIRTPDARWVTARFDGGCDPCVEVLDASEQPVGEACFDDLAAPMFAAVDRLEGAW